LKLFGFEFNRIEPSYLKQDKVANDSVSFVERDADSTAAVVYASPYSSGSYADINGNIKTEAEFISKYREISGQAEVYNAISEIVNEAVCTDQDFVVKIDLDKVPLEDQAKQIIKQQFDEVLKLFDFESMAYEIFKRWYIDGRLYYHAVIDNKNPQDGIKELRYVDPRKLREIREVKNQKIPGAVSNQAAEVQTIKNEYYLYSEKGFTPIARPYGSQGDATSGIRISKDSIVHVPSGLTDVNGTIGLSYLHMAIKIVNELRTLEDSLIIYRLSRAPERRVWNVDVTNMPPAKAQQYLKTVMDLQKNRLIYDASSGQIRDDRKFMSMTEDFWMPKWGDRGTTVQMLQGGQNLGNIEDIVYFQGLLYNSLNVPTDRLQPDTPFGDNTQQISRAEDKFTKFINRIRQQFSTLFTKTLQKHVVLKGLMSIEEFEYIEKLIKYKFASASHYSDLVDQQVFGSQVQTYMLFEQAGLIGKYFSNKWVRRNIFKQTEEDIIQMTQEIMEEMENPLYAPSDQQGGASEGQSDEEGQSANASQAQAPVDNSDKQENARHVIQALSNIKHKSPEEEEQMKKASELLHKQNNKNNK
jgi:hypothetical protein